MKFAKGHGTGNDFVIIPDLVGELKLDADMVRALCDRHKGIGADGVLRVVRTAYEPDAASYVGAAEFFMDYRNSDGSIAQMCGNGARVFARYLVDNGLMAPGQWPVATRGGLRQTSVVARGEVSVEMGVPTLAGRSQVQIGGREFTGVMAAAPNPHLVCQTAIPLAELDLSQPPILDPTYFDDGANVELVNVLAPGHVQMRVFERGSGQTLSCGTGACAVAAVAAQDLPGENALVMVEVDGGSLAVTLRPGSCVLTGPAVIVAEGEWLG